MLDLVSRIVERGLVTREQADTALLEAGKSDLPVWFVFVKLDYLSEESIVRFFAQEARIPYVHIPDYRIKQGVLKILDEFFCRQNTVIPLWLVGGTLFVACNNPFNMALLDSIGKLSGCSVEPLIATSTAIIQALDYYWRIDKIGFDMADFIVSPEMVKGMAMWRKSERIKIDWPVSITVQDDAIALAFESRIEGRTRDISRDGSAIGIGLPLFLPRGIAIAMSIRPSGGGKKRGAVFTVSGEIIQSYMNKTPDYPVGIRFKNAQGDIQAALLRYAMGMNKS
ncbi:MAG: PilZ domain-containing protein [Candidatus Omnitrophota bacterium]